MTNNLQHQAMLTNLQNQLNAMQSLAQQASQTPAATAPVSPDINALVKSAVAAEIAKLKAEQVATPVSQSGGNALTSFLPIIGAALTEEQQLFLSNPNILMGLPGFLMSKGGKDAMQLLVSEFQTFSKA